MFGVGAGMISLGVDGIAGLVIFGLLIRYLPAKSAGYWILITTTGTFLNLLQGGFALIVPREIGQTRIPENLPRLPQLLGAVRRAYAWVAMLLVLVAIAFYAFYLRGAAKIGNLGSESTVAWFLYAGGVLMYLQGQGRLFILDGFGEVGWEKVFRIFFTTFGLAANWIALRAGANLITLGIIYAVQNALFWLAAARKLHIALPITRVTAPPAHGQLLRLAHDGGKILILSLNNFAVNYFGVYVVQNRFGLAAVAPFTAIVKVGFLLGSVAILLPQMLYPYVATAWASRDRDRLRRYYLLGVGGAVGVFVMLAIPVFLLREPLFTHWLGKGKFLGTATLAAFLLYQLIYVHQCAQAAPVFASNGNAFIVPSIISAILTPILVVILARWFGFVGIPLGMIVGTLPSAFIVIRAAWRFIMQPKTCSGVPLDLALE